ncbi:unnamed protein product [Schistocephalus solidus]|uniref:Uncharacterized protein n=1 Tax=Schistocephalus solidus TaxID=70667 RepID=A0A183ST91_SCHSO|nr:unnamed protein product [Schistocephalus solidus]
MWLREAKLRPVATPQATTTTDELNYVTVSGVVCASKPGMVAPFPYPPPYNHLSARPPSHLPTNSVGCVDEPAHSNSLECLSPFRQSAEQMTGMEDGAGRSGTGTLESGFHRTQRHRFTEQGQLDEAGTSYIFFWSDCPQAD